MKQQPPTSLIALQHVSCLRSFRRSFRYSSELPPEVAILRVPSLSLRIGFAAPSTIWPVNRIGRGLFDFVSILRNGADAMNQPMGGAIRSKLTANHAPPE